MTTMLGFAVVCAAIVATGCGVARRLRVDFATGALVGVILWIAVNWALAISFALTRRNLAIAAALFVIAGAASLRRPSFRASTLIVLAPIAVWCAFVLWRGSVVPPLSHDALAYHLPKAVMIARAHGYERFDVPDLRIAAFPSNYELLLADVLILEKSDALTEWIGTAFYLLFLAVVAAIVRRWWGAGLHVTACVLAAAGAPLLLLHSGHDKNDVMTAAFAAAALYWSATWCVRRGAVPAMLAIVCGAAAVGTKMSAAAVVLGIAPFGIAALVRRPPPLKAFAAALLFAACALLLCGGWVFVKNIQAPATPNVAAGLPVLQYGEWRHLWEVPYLAVRASLGLGGKWPWPAENLFSSHYGPLFGLAALALPFCIWRYRRDGEDAVRKERTIAGAAAAIAFFVLTPLIQYPQIALPSILRYTAFILPFVYGWTIAPLSRGSRYAPALVAGFIAIFAVNALDMAWNDTLAPLPYARWCAEHPGTREIFWASNHAESVVDRLAGPHDTIAVRAGGDAWVYPAYGAPLSRTVVFVRNGVPDTAQWVAIDDDPQFINALARDPRFSIVYRQERQAVFRRKS
jgi:hypothetical protein